MHTPRLFIFVSTFICATLVTQGCTSTAKKPVNKPVEKQLVQKKPEQTEPKTIPEALTGQTFYGLFLGELAIKAGDIGYAQALYQQSAEFAQDPYFEQQSYKLAQIQNNPQEQYQAALLWVTASPNSPDAWKARASSEIALENLDAIDSLLMWLKLDNDAQVNQLAKDFSQQPSEYNQWLLAQLNQTDESLKNNHHFWLLVAALNESQRDWNNALLSAQSAQKLQKSASGYLFIFNSQRALGKPLLAKSTIDEAFKAFPNNRALVLTFSTLAQDKTSWLKADAMLTTLQQNQPQDLYVQFVRAQTNISLKNWSKAKELLVPLTRFQDFQAQALFSLAQIEESQNNVDNAIDYYSQVPHSDVHRQAVDRAAQLLLDHIDERAVFDFFAQYRLDFPSLKKDYWHIESDFWRAQQLDQISLRQLQQALIEVPQDTSLLYQLALILDNVGEYDQALDILQKLAKKEPESAFILNALGYTLTIRTQDYNQALPLIERALELNPNDGATLDSLGWLWFKLGDLENALGYLTQAYQILPNDEVAAHLGEAYWVNGEIEKAEQLWQQSLEQFPKSKIIKETINRLSNQAALEPSL